MWPIDRNIHHIRAATAPDASSYTTTSSSGPTPSLPRVAVNVPAAGRGWRPAPGGAERSLSRSTPALYLCRTVQVARVRRVIGLRLLR